MSPARTTRPYRGMHRALTGCLLLLCAAASHAQPSVKQVLVLQSLDRGNMPLDYFTGEFRVRLDQATAKPVNVVQMVVGLTGTVGAPEQSVVDYIRSMYVGRPAPDLIVTTGGPAAVFARNHRQQLFPKTPLLFASVDQRYLGGAPLRDNETAVAVVNDFPRVVDDILRVLPDTRQIFMVLGAGAIGQFWHRELATAFSRFGDRVTFVWSETMSLQEIQQRVATLPENSAIFYIAFGTDGEGGAYADEQVVADLHARATAPLFGELTALFGHGIVGGAMVSIGDLARSAADVAGRLLNGESPATIRLAPQTPGPPTFDWRELQRWNIPESRLPAGSVVRYRTPTLWEEHRNTVLAAAAALVLQTFLIAALLYQSRAKRRAEIDSHRNLALAADANRRETISAMATSIGHELGQPLSAIVHNVRALQTMMTSSRTSFETTGEILADIHSEAALATQIVQRHRTMLRSHELQRKPIDLHAVLRDSMSLVAHDVAAAHIETVLDLSSMPYSVDADHVLLTQVFTNLIRNAVDALADVPPTRRRITIRTTVGAMAEVSVSDTGPGLSPEVAAALFTPFVTTKAHGVGIGLTIVERIVEAHGGTITACGNPDGGATFTVMLPRAATPAHSSGPRLRRITPDRTAALVD